ncbi:MAG TPA: RNA polymerase subunit sigma-24 [Hydrogenophaga sp.]|uniref:RNA polymerase sigma factor n=1 Tax=Hydrogenophaga sp. TaxID=1904254 RepID=UPI0008D368F8|nr:sigma-70 family RNA polymerase sigma factor [Hydrogenophaga sp.]OGA73889.1 MAG: RNA polymerase subunit sigma-24 [Burkholderiales bacterium GWE1_65_30]OGA91771.1 MAG: RNA polymerase subunit sigma-24 [Burkholderiales bacterium GWF1_66_17]HAX20337.1 RNA polymerase subunit sigma-24 [Hydrogenophaga sp.]HBU18891.1 RNA polymerase subunit sigma-24 [Hydrogenophaga sp.]
MPAALKRKDKDGKRYERPPEIEACIETLDALDAGVRLSRFDGASKKHPQYVPTEAVLHFLRRAWVDGDQGQFEKIFRILLKRIDQSLYSAISDRRMDGAADIRDEIRSRFVVLLTRDCNAHPGLLDFYEIRFDKAMVALRTTVLRKIGPATRKIKTVPLGSQDGEGPEISAEVESALEDFLSGDPQKIDDPAFRLVLFAAIDQLPQDQKQVIGLFLQGIPNHSEDPDVMTIARTLDCDERTVRNRKARACKALKAILEKEAEL